MDGAPVSEKIVEVKIYAKPGTDGGGLVLWIKSARVEEIFKRMAQGNKSRALGKTAEDEAHHILQAPVLKWLKGVLLWAVPSPPALPSENWAWSSSVRTVVGNGFNLKTLTFVGLSNGVEFPLELPMSNSMLKTLLKIVKEACRELIVEYGKASPRFSGSLTEFDLAAPTPPR